MFLLLSLLTLVFPCSAQAEPGALKFVHVIFRHGDRTPISHYPTDPYSARSEWPVGPGQLTSIGKSQHFLLGQQLRQTYGGGRLLGETYSEEEVVVRSTDVDRTLMSAQANLAGLFPPSGYLEWNPELAWQPVPVHTVAQQRDSLLSSTHSLCPRLVELREAAARSDWAARIYRENEELLRYLSLHTGQDIDSILKLDWLYDTLLVEQLYNKTLPAWTHQVFPGGKFEEIRNLVFILGSLTHEMMRLQAGPFLTQLVSDWREVQAGSKMKMKIFSAHDDTLSFILNSLGVFDGLAPAYASAIMFELYQLEDRSYSVRLLYHNTTPTSPPTPPLTLPLPGCQELCPLSTWLELTENLRPEDWEAECRAGTARDEGDVETGNTDLPLMIFLPSLLLVVMLFVFLVRAAARYEIRRREYLEI